LIELDIISFATIFSIQIISNFNYFLEKEIHFIFFYFFIFLCLLVKMILKVDSKDETNSTTIFVRENSLSFLRLFERDIKQEKLLRNV